MVYDAVRHVPRGTVTTYGAIADHLNCAAPRAIGQALKRNPFAPDVPCHRVVASDLSLGGFRGKRAGPAIAQKRRMLESEGLSFDNNRLLICTGTEIFTFGEAQ